MVVILVYEKARALLMQMVKEAKSRFPKAGNVCTTNFKLKVSASKAKGKLQRTCGAVGCTFTDKHNSPHSFELDPPMRNAKRVCEFVRKDNGKLQKTIAYLDETDNPVHGVHGDESSEQLGRPTTEPCEAADQPCEAADETRDTYDSCAKRVTRVAFATYCIDAARSTNNKAILYLESPYGGATNELLKHFTAEQLYPCNKSADVVAVIKNKFPGVNAVKANIYNLYKTRNDWLGVWMDTEETWQHNHRDGQPWRLDAIPDFDGANVFAVTLTIGSGPNPIRGGAETLAVELAQLFQERNGKMDMLPYAYDGKGGRTNMVFGIAKFNPYMRWDAKHYERARLRIPVTTFGKFAGREDYRVDDGHYIATVTVKEDKLMPVFMSKYGSFFDDADPLDELTVKQVNMWMHF